MLLLIIMPIFLHLFWKEGTIKALPSNRSNESVSSLSASASAATITTNDTMIETNRRAAVEKLMKLLYPLNDMVEPLHHCLEQKEERYYVNNGGKPINWEFVNFTTFGDQNENEWLLPTIQLLFYAYNRTFDLILHQKCPPLEEDLGNFAEECSLLSFPYYEGCDNENPDSHARGIVADGGLWRGTVKMADGTLYFVDEPGLMDWNNPLFQQKDEKDGKLSKIEIFHSVIYRDQDLSCN